MSDELRQEVDSVVLAIKGIVAKVKDGVNIMVIMGLMPDIMAVLATGAEFGKLDAAGKAAFGGEVFDALIGSETDTAVVKSLFGIEADDLESLSDSIKIIVVKKLEAKFAAV